MPLQPIGSLGQFGTGVWPAAIATPRPIDPPPVLYVPLGTRPTERQPAAKARDTRVEAGERLTEAPVEQTHAPLAPVRGRLGSIRGVTIAGGRRVAAIELFPEPAATATPAPADAPAAAPTAYRPPQPAELAGFLDRVRTGGVWADRTASPDLIGQLNQALRRPIDTVICTALDSDATIRPAATIAARAAVDVVTGVAAVAGATGARRVLIAVEESAPSAWQAPLLRRAARAANIRVVELPNDYPQADPTLVLYTLAGRRLRPGRLPTEQGVVLLDAAAAAAVGALARDGKPMLTVPVTLHDHTRRQAHLLDAPIGTPLLHLLAQFGVAADSSLRAGDLLRDRRMRAASDPLAHADGRADVVVLAGGELSVHASAAERPTNPAPCIRCGWCFEACPTRVQPAVLLEAAQLADRALADRGGIDACIECGLCSHVCPSKLPLLDAIRTLRAAQGSVSRGEPSDPLARYSGRG